jgi:hypothetical protein
MAAKSLALVASRGTRGRSSTFRPPLTGIGERTAGSEGRFPVTYPRPYNLGMQTLVALIAVSVALLFGACASDEKEWMKVDTKYTVAEFRRDYAACSKGVKLDENCMQSKGWVGVSPGASVGKAVAPATPGPPTGITNR